MGCACTQVRKLVAVDGAGDSGAMVEQIEEGEGLKPLCELDVGKNLRDGVVQGEFTLVGQPGEEDGGHHFPARTEVEEVFGGEAVGRACFTDTGGPKGVDAVFVDDGDGQTRDVVHKDDLCGEFGQAGVVHRGERERAWWLDRE
jgi:hypothetical protein